MTGFFADKAADAKARGEKLPKKKDPKQEYDDFMRSIQEDVKEVEQREEDEAAAAALERAAREEFENQ